MGGQKKRRQEVSVRNGSWNGKPHRKREIVPVRDGRPDAPLLVSGDELAMALWDETCDLLQGMRFLCLEDKPILEAYVLNYALLLRCIQDIQKNGDTYTNKDGGVKASGNATNYARFIQTHKRLLGELGLTPSSRASLAAPSNRKPGDDSKVGSLLEKLGGG